MIYIISGASRSGKTICAKELSVKKQIPYLSLDYVMMGFAGGMYNVGIHPEKMPNVNAKIMWPSLENMMVAMIENEEDYIFEGEQFMPEDVHRFTETYSGKMKSLFFGYTEIDSVTKIEEVKKHATKTDWLVHHMDDYIDLHINNMITYSKFVKSECEVNNVAYMDTSKDFIKTINKALEYLM